MDRKIPTIIYKDKNEASVAVANEIADLIKKQQAAKTTAVLGLATGATPLSVYAELIRLHREEGLSFKNVITFNLDEYYPMSPSSEQSYVAFMNKFLFDHVDIPIENIHIPDGTLTDLEIDVYCQKYEQEIADVGGLDIQLLGIGRTGHIGFNEPGSTADSLTRVVELNEITRQDAALTFGGLEFVPAKAITMGVGTIARAKKIILLAFGKEKANIVRKTLRSEICSDIPATYLQGLHDVVFVLDQAAAIHVSE